MALVPRHTRAELALLRGPCALPSYEGERFAWFLRPLRGAIGLDWNTFMTLPDRINSLAERIHAIAEHHEMLLTPVATDADAPIRKAVATLRWMCEMWNTSAGSAATTIDCIAMDVASAPIDERVVQEWAAWVDRMERCGREEVDMAMRLRTVISSSLSSRKRAHSASSSDVVGEEAAASSGDAKRLERADEDGPPPTDQ